MRYGMIIDLTECVRCRTCVVDCKAANHIPSQFDISVEPGKPVGRIWFEEHPVGTYPNVSMSFAPYLCMQCDDAPCIAACPEGAFYKRDDGIVAIDKDKCKGSACSDLCISACPYGVVYYRDDLDIVDKCDLCAEARLDKGRLPSCLEKCPGECFEIGDLDDPSSLISARLAEGNAKPLSPELGTKPKVYYIGSDADFQAMAERKNESIEATA